MSAYEKNMDYDYSEYDYLIGIGTHITQTKRKIALLDNFYKYVRISLAIEFGSTVTRIAHHRLSLEEALIIDERWICNGYINVILAC